MDSLCLYIWTKRSQAMEVAHMHSGEYDGPTVKKELMRIAASITGTG